MYILQNTFTLHSHDAHHSSVRVCICVGGMGGVTIVLVLQTREQVQRGCIPSSAPKQLILLKETIILGLSCPVHGQASHKAILFCDSLTDQD